MFKTYLLIITILCQTYLVAQLNWSNINGPTGGSFQFISLKNINEIFIASEGKNVFYSSDQGNNWIKRVNGLNSLDFTSLISNDSDTYVSTRTNGVYRFSASDNSWIQINSGLTNTNILTLAADTSGNIYAGCDVGLLFKLSRGSNNWVRLLTGSIDRISVFHVDKDNNFYLSSSYLTTYGGLYKSSNQGVSWIKISPYWMQGDCYAITTDISGNIYFGSGNQIFRSSNSGATWDTVGTFGEPGLKCVDLLSIGDEDIFGLINDAFSPDSRGRMVHSQNHGQNWEEIGLQNFGLNKLAYDNLYNILYAATDKGVFKSNDLGINWIDINSSMDALNITDLIIDKNGVIYLSTYAGFYKSSENSSAWISLFNGVPLWNRMAIFDSSLYSYGNGFYIYDQYSQEWIQKSEFGSIDMEKDSFGNLYICGGNCLWKSEDHGNSWQSILSNIPYITANCIEYLKDSILIVGGSGSGSYRTTNLGRVWESIPVAGADELFYNDDSLIIATWGAFETRSTDLGVTWQEFYLYNVPIFCIEDIIFPQTTEMYATAIAYGQPINSGIFYSNNLGYSWSRFNQPGDLKFLDYSVSDSTIYAGYSTSIYKSKITVTNLEESNIGIVMEMNLSQNYPNPFNPSTVINYSIREAGLVKIKVYDILGSEVATLINETKESGNFAVEFNASNLPSGVYIYTLQVNGYTNSKKMLLLK